MTDDRRPRTRPRRRATPHRWVALVATLLVASCATPDAPPPERHAGRSVAVEIEGGPVWQSRNDVRIPGDTGTRFALDDLTGDGPFGTGRVTVDWDVNSRHAVRGVVAPLEFSDTGTLQQTTNFDGRMFPGGVATKGTYKFSSYRLGYRYTFFHDEHWRLRVGGTLFVRDAKIELEQPTIAASDSDVGVVPLLSLAADYYPADRWRIAGEFDGLAGGPGRAFDVSLKAHYDVSDAWSVGVGYRTIEGGVDNDTVFNFAWLHSAVAAVTFRF